MGNTKSQKLKENYIKGKFKVIDNQKDQLLNQYRILQFTGFSSETYIQKILNPSEYDEYADINEFIKKLSNTCKFICEFHFVEYNSQNQDLFDLIFEFGTFLKLPLVKEKYIWMLIDNVTDAMIFLEDNMLHYPFLHKNYIIQISNKSFKLLNPYCFPDYLKEVLQIYMNPMNPVSNRRIYSQTQIRRNIKEFGVMIITLIKSMSIQRLLKEPNYWKDALGLIKPTVSEDLVTFIAYILDNKPTAPTSFHNIKEELKKYKSNFEKTGLKIFGNTKRLTPRKKEDVKEHKNKKPIQVSNMTQSLNTLENQDNKLSVESTTRTVVTDIEDEKKVRVSPRSDINFKKNQIQNQILEEQPSPQLPPEDQKALFIEPEDPEAVEENIEQSRQQSANHKRGSFNKLGLFNSKEKDNQEFEFINHQPSPNKNMTSYFKNQSNVKQSALSNYYLDEVEDIQDESTDQVENENMIQKNMVKVEEQKVNSQPDLPENTPQLKPNYSLPVDQEQPAKKFVQQSLPPQPTHTPVQQVSPSQAQKKKSVKRVLIRWLREEGRYQKTIEYTDGTSEAVEMDNEESSKYGSYSLNAPIKQPTKPSITTNAPEEKKSHMANYDYSNVNPFNQNISQMSADNLIILTLIKDEFDPPLLLFKTHKDKNIKLYSDISNIVGKESAIKPSNYHQIDDDPTVDLRGINFEQSVSMEESVSKPTALKSINEMDNLNDTNNSMPTSFGNQKRLVINRKVV